MDNVPEMTPAAPSQGQPAAQAQTPNSDASGTNPTSGAVDGATPAGESGQATQGFELPDKFKGKTAEEIAQEYVKLESYNKKVEMDKAELTKLFVEQPTEKSVPPSAAPEPTDDDPMAALRPMLKDEFGKLLSPVITKIEIEETVRKYGDDFVKVAPQVSELKKQNPTLTLDAAYKIVAFDNIQRTAMNQGAAQAQKAQEQAQKAQLESSKPSGVRPTTLDDAIKDPSVPLKEVFDALGPEYSLFAEETKRRAGRK